MSDAPRRWLRPHRATPDRGGACARRRASRTRLPEPCVAGEPPWPIPAPFSVGIGITMRYERRTAQVARPVSSSLMSARPLAAPLLAGVLVLTASAARAADLPPRTVQAFDKYANDVGRDF